MRTAETITKAELQAVRAYAYAVCDRGLAACAARALDGGSLYHCGLLERCASAYNRFHIGTLTARTITDEQINGLRERLLLENDDSGAAWDCGVALGGYRAQRGDSRAKARARVAQFLNERTERT